MLPFEANCSVTPAGVPLTATETAELNPFTAVKEIVVAADPPRAAVMLAGDALSVNVAGDDTVNRTVAVFEKLPLVPLIAIE